MKEQPEKPLRDVEIIDIGLMTDGTVETRIRDRESGRVYDIPGPCLTVRLLAAPFASHPAYDPAWAVPMS
jgi:hypothetical protein